MSATTKRAKDATEEANPLDAPRPPEVRAKPREQTPWTSPTDREGWRTVARGAGTPGRISTSYKVRLDEDQSEWLERESERTGRSPIELLRDFLVREMATRP